MKSATLSITMCLLLVMSIFFGALNFIPTAKGEQGAPYDTGFGYWQTDADWIIEPGDTISHENKTIYVNGDLIVNGTLILTNVTIKMSSATYDGEYNITILENGNLVIQDYDDDPDTISDASVIESSTIFRFGFQAYSGSRLQLKNSELYDCGWSTSLYVDGIGLFINSDWVNVTGNIIEDSYFAAVIWDCNNVTFANNTIDNIEDMGVYTRWADNCYLKNNTLYNIQSFGFYLLNSTYFDLSYNKVFNSPNAYGISLVHLGGHDVYNNTLDNNEIGVFVHGEGYSTLYCEIFENEISNCDRGIHVQGLNIASAVHHLYIYDNDIYSNTDYGIMLYGDDGPFAINNVYIFNNTVNNTETGAGHGVRFLSNTWFGDVVDIFCWDNEIRDNDGAGYYLDSVSYVNIVNDYLARNNRNLWVDSSDHVFVENTTLEDGVDLDIRVDNDYGNPPAVTLLNTTFDKGSADVFDAGSVLNVKWYLDVRVMQWGVGVDNADVWIEDFFGDPEPAGQPFNTGSGSDGWVRWLPVTEFNRTAGGTIYFTPHHIDAANGSAIGYADPTMDISKEVIVYLNIPPTTDNITSSASSVYRGNTIYITANGSDGEDSEDLLTPHFEYKEPGGASWVTPYLGTPTYIGSAPSGFWDVSFNPPGNAPLGYYDFRVNFNDTDGYFSNWITVTNMVEVLNNQPIADAGPDDDASAGIPYTFNGSGSWDDDDIVSYMWDIDDSDGWNWITPDLIGVSPSYNYTVPGVYNVTLRVEDAQGEFDLDTVQITVLDIDPPNVDAGNDDFAVVGIAHDFDASASTDNVGIVWYNWSFADGSYDNGTNITPQHIYSLQGIYIVTLNCSDAAGNWAIDTVTITVNPSAPPVANAGPDNSTDEDSMIIFNGSASTDDLNDIVNYTWDIDASDGLDFSNPDLWGVEVNWTYYEPGIYVVTLNVTDGDGAWDLDTLSVTVLDITPPIADAGPNDIINEDTSYQFDGSLSTDNSGTIAFYNWSFGDGNYANGTDPTPSHSYDNPGFYTVTLNASDEAGNWALDTLTMEVLDITSPDTNAGLDQIVDQYDTVNFDGSGSTDNVGIDNYTWSFMYDGQEKYLYGPNPQFTFDIPGLYEVTLNVSDVAGNWGLDVMNITVSDVEWPSADAGLDQIVDQHTIVIFDGSGSTDNVGIENYTWNFFYDAQERYLFGPNPQFTFDIVGVYTVTLNVSDSEGYWDTDTMDVTVLDVDDPVANAGMDQAQDQHTIVNFDGSGSTDNVGIDNYTWNFFYDGQQRYLYGPNPQFMFDIVGLYVVTLTVNDSAGNDDTDTMNVTVLDITSPTADAGLNQTVDQHITVIFDGTGSSDNVGIDNYTWTFTYDGSQIDIFGPLSMFTFDLAGDYVVLLKVTDAAGNWDTDTVNITVLDITPPEANAGSDDTINEDTLYIFDGTLSSDNSGVIAFYNWSFGDGSYANGTETQPSHTYDQPGVYAVILNVTDSAGNWKTDTIQITVMDITPPVADAGQDVDVDEDTQHIFDGSNSFDNVGIATYAWDIDASDGLNWISPNYSGVSPSHTYTDPGTYIATLNVTDSEGYWSIDTVVITVLDITPPTAKAGPDDSVNNGTAYPFYGHLSTDNSGSIAFYNWSFGDGTYANGTEPRPVHTFTSPGFYIVILTITDDADNSATDTLNITVIDISEPDADAGLDDTISEDTPYTLDGSNSYDDVDIVSYAWDIDKGDGIDWDNPDYIGISPVHIYETPGTYIVTLNVTDAQGNWNINEVVITVSDITPPVLNVEFVDTVYEDVEYEFNASNSYDNVAIATYRFIFGDGFDIDGSESAVTYTYKNPGTYIFTVNITDAGGNWNTTSWLVIVRDTTPPSIPNNLTVSKIPNGSALYISWDSNIEEDLNHYKLYFSEDGVTFIILEDEISPATSSIVHPDLTNGETYFYYIVAIDDSGHSSESSNIISGIPEMDFDGDTIFDSEDQDDDGDGVNDELDAFPKNSSEWYDTDEDGIGDNTDNDDDNDSVPDTEDAFPLDDTEWLDTDGDGIGNNADTDDDGDGVKDGKDDYPLDKSRWEKEEPFDLMMILFLIMVIVTIVVALVLGAMLNKRNKENRELQEKIEKMEKEQAKPKPPEAHRPPRIVAPKPTITPSKPEPVQPIPLPSIPPPKPEEPSPPPTPPEPKQAELPPPPPPPAPEAEQPKKEEKKPKLPSESGQ